jgi:hypothetical protein
MRLTDQQVTAAFVAVVGTDPRPADLAVVRSLGGTAQDVAEYLWDHWMGEPLQPTLAEVTEWVTEAVAS